MTDNQKQCLRCEEENKRCAQGKNSEETTNSTGKVEVKIEVNEEQEYKCKNKWKTAKQCVREEMQI